MFRWALFKTFAIKIFCDKDPLNFTRHLSYSMIKHQWTTKIAMLWQRWFETLQPPLSYEPVPVLTIKNPDTHPEVEINTHKINKTGYHPNQNTNEYETSLGQIWLNDDTVESPDHFTNRYTIQI